MNTEQKQRIEQIQEKLRAGSHYRWDYTPDVSFLLSLVKSQEASKEDMNRLAFAIESAAVKAGIMQGDQPMTLTCTQLLFLCDDLANTPASMRSACVAKLRQIAADYDNVAQPNNGAAISKQALLYAARQLESVSIQEQKEFVTKCVCGVLSRTGQCEHLQEQEGKQ